MMAKDLGVIDMNKIQLIEKIRKALKAKVWTMGSAVLRRRGGKYDVLPAYDIDKVLDAELEIVKSER